MLEKSKTDADRMIMSRDTSLFERMPAEVAWPKDTTELAALVKEVHAEKEAAVARGAAADSDEMRALSVTARAAGTDMGGGPLNDGTIAVFTKHMNKVIEVATDEENCIDDTPALMDASGAIIPRADGTSGYAVTEPGVFYRDFETETLKKGLLLPSYPASRDLCAMGGIVANNAGGERTLEYGKTDRYVQSLEAVLSDGSVVTFGPVSPAALEDKVRLPGLEGAIYRGMRELLTKNAGLVAAKKPKVSKNSAGYALWDVIDPATRTFNLAKLICGSQGTLALWTKATLRLVKPKGHRAMLVVMLKDLSHLPEIVSRVLPLRPESFESYDDKTFTLATRFLLDMLKQMGLARAIHLGIEFIPEIETVLTGGVPKLILMAEFARDSIEEADRAAYAAQEALKELGLSTKIERNEAASEKYWIVRRESFALLRKSLHGYYAAPFIDDFVVPPSTYAQFLPELSALLARYEGKFIYTIAGHIGDGNFHIIPLMDLNKPESRAVIQELAPQVYDLVIRYGGTTTGEHNDGIIRTPYVAKVFGPEMEALFEETKRLFDPLNILNPGKKVGGTTADIEKYLLQKS